MRIIQYATFGNNEEFGMWQRENPESVVSQIMPWVSGIDISGKSKSGSNNTTQENLEGTTSCGVFVVYVTEG